MRHGWRWVAAAALAGASVGAGAVGGVAWSGGPAKARVGCGGSSPQLTVQGTGTATGTPNRLLLTAGVSVLGGTAQSALGTDDARTAAVVAALTSGGLPARDVQTTNLSVQPDYTTTGSSTVLAGYAVDNSVVATVDNLSKAGALIDALTAAAGNDVRIDSLSFTMADPRPLQNQARLDAVRQARSHAAAMAAAAGERLAGICSVTDQSSGTPPRQPFVNGAMAAAAGVPLEPGTQQVSAQVQLVYAVEPAARR